MKNTASSSDTITKSASAPQPEEIDLDTLDVDAADPATLLKILIDQKSNSRDYVSPELRELNRLQGAIASATPISRELPEDPDLHPDHFLVIHHGVQSCHGHKFIASNIYSGVLFQDAETGNFYSATIASGFTWIPKHLWDGSFAERPQHKVLQQSVEAGILTVLPPGMPMTANLLTRDFREKAATSFLQFCKDEGTCSFFAKARSARFYANLAKGLPVGDALARVAAELERFEANGTPAKPTAGALAALT